MGVDRWEGKSAGTGFRIAIIVSRYNPIITDALLGAALSLLVERGVENKDIEVAKVPGAFEIPGLAKRMAQMRRFDAIICLGAVIQGETPHFDFICSEVSRGIGSVSLEFSLPVIFGILTTTTLEQALARSGSEEKNKGSEAAMAAIEMVHLYRDFK